MCGERFSVDHAMICKRSGFIIQRHNQLRDLEADLLDLVCNDVETEPVLKEITGETLNSGANWPVTPASASMHVDFGRDRSRPFLI